MDRQTDLDRLVTKVADESLKLKAGDRVFIDLFGAADDLAEALIHRIYAVGAMPFIRAFTIKQIKAIIAGGSKESMTLWAKQELYKLKHMTAYISIRADDNIFEFNDIPQDKFDLYLKNYAYPMTAGMAATGRYIILKYPTYGMAQLANMSLESFTDLYFQACTMDYAQLERQGDVLKKLLSQTDHVRIVSPDTDLSFSIKGIDNYFCNGTYNLPDGELFTAPVPGTMNGSISFNVPSVFLGMVFGSIRLEVRDGVIIDAHCKEKPKLMSILQADEGASRFGEFGIGINPHLKVPVSNLLFDEKMAGSIHLAIGHALPMADNGNVSSVHWDLVLSQLGEHGGGELYFDNVLVRKDGYFVLPELVGLNPIG